MEKKRAMLISSVCFAIAIGLISAYTSILRKEMTANFGEEVGVVIANRNPKDISEEIREYAIIRPEMLEVIPVFKKFVQAQTVTVPLGDDVAAERAINDIKGKAAYVPIYPGEQITLTKLVQQDGKPVLDKQVERKMRAVTVQISPATGVGRLIQPGNHVDILAAVSYEQNSSLQFEVKTMFQNVLVLATGKNLQNSVPSKFNGAVLSAIEAKFDEQRRKDLYTTNVDSGTSRPDDNYSNLTVQLSPEDAEKLLFLQHTIGDSRLYFTLRNGADAQVAKLETTILDQVLGPDSDFGRGKIKPIPFTPVKPKFYDSKGGTPVPIY